MVKDVRLLKQLQSQLSSINADREALKIEITNKQHQLSQLKSQAKNLQDQIDSLCKTKKIKVSEHAILRYFERVKGYDLDLITNEIVNEKTISMINTLGGNGKYPVNNHQIVLKDYTIVTIV